VIRLRVPGPSGPAALTPWGRGVAALVALAGAGAALAASRHGVAITADSAAYVAAARSFAAGHGWISYNGSPLVVHPPGLATVLGLLALAGPDPAVGVRWLDALAFGGTLYLAAAWLLTRLRSLPLALAGALVPLCSPPLIVVAAAAWSETLFIFLVTAALVAGERHAATGRRGPLAAFAALTALALATRYAGAPLVAVGAVLVALYPEGGWGRRLGRAAAFTAVAVLPAALWLARNLWVAGTALGARLPGGGDPGGVAAEMGRLVAAWFVPPAPLPGPGGLTAPVVAALACGALALLGIAGCWMGWRPGRGGEGRAASAPLWAPAWAQAGFAAAYAVFIVVAKARIGEMEARYAFPLIVPLFLTLLWALDRAVDGARRRLEARPARLGSWAVPPGLPAAAATVLVGVWLAAHPARAAYVTVVSAARHGFPPYATEAWRRLDVVRELPRALPPGRVLSNAPHLVYWHARREAGFLPRRRDLDDPAARTAFLDGVARRLKGPQPLFLALFRIPGDRASWGDLAPLLALRPVWVAPDRSGAVLRVVGIAPPARAPAPGP
jgi:4-amino-4-deoxy-L-arabinose transferase-like glycosyltransferase